jgi:hypothetical protein
MDLVSSEFIMHKTTNTHSRINVAVEFVHDLESMMTFAHERGYTAPPEKRENVLYLDRKT